MDALSRLDRSDSRTKLGLGVLSLVSFWTLTGGRISFKKNKIVNFFPGFVYDVVVTAFFPLNWAICGLCYIQLSKSEWNEPQDQLVTPQALRTQTDGKDLNSIKEKITNQKDITYDELDLVKLYDTLPPAPTEEFLVGKSFNGMILRTGESVLDMASWCLVKPLQLLGFNWGKRYETQHKGDPLFLNWMKVFYIPIPMWGSVGVCDIKWRGVTTGTMNYDHLPWKDYFRVLINEPNKIMLLGVWTSKDKAGGWFTLTYDPSVPMN